MSSKTVSGVSLRDGKNFVPCSDEIAAGYVGMGGFVRATLVIGPGKVFTEEEVKAILTKVDEVIECYFDTYGHMGGDAHDLQEEFRDIVLKHGLTL